MGTITLAPELLHKMDAYWRAANYLSVGQLYLHDNPLLRKPLKLSHVMSMLIGHWGKYQAPQWLTIDAAIEHCTKGIGIDASIGERYFFYRSLTDKVSSL